LFRAIGTPLEFTVSISDFQRKLQLFEADFDLNRLGYKEKPLVLTKGFKELCSKYKKIFRRLGSILKRWMFSAVATVFGNR
jgi:hypothetical protein